MNYEDFKELDYEDWVQEQIAEETREENEAIQESREAERKKFIKAEIRKGNWAVMF